MKLWRLDENVLAFFNRRVCRWVQEDRYPCHLDHPGSYCVSVVSSFCVQSRKSMVIEGSSLR